MGVDRFCTIKSVTQQLSINTSRNREKEKNARKIFTQAYTTYTSRGGELCILHISIVLTFADVKTSRKIDTPVLPGMEL
jgi:hypothetical protein